MLNNDKTKILNAYNIFWTNLWRYRIKHKIKIFNLKILNGILKSKLPIKFIIIFWVIKIERSKWKSTNSIEINNVENICAKITIVWSKIDIIKLVYRKGQSWSRLLHNLRLKQGLKYRRGKNFK